MSSSSLRLVGKVMLAALVIAACKVETDLELELSPSSLVLPAGGSAQVGVTVTASSDDASWSTEADAPDGISIEFSNKSSSGNQFQATMTVSVAPGTGPGTYPVEVTAFTANSREDAKATLTVTVTAPPAFALSCPGSLSVTQGQANTATCSLTRSGGFTGGVTLDLLGAPTGCTGSFSPNPVTGATSVLNLGCVASVAAGPYSVTVRGTGTGVTSQTAPISLTVVAAQAPGFSLGVGSASLSITQGQSATNAITITKTGGFTGNVALALEGAPSGVTGSFSPNPASGTSSSLTVTVGAATAPGSYTLTVKGTASGLPDQTATFSLTVGVAGNYTLSAVNLAVPQGSTGGTTITITRTGGNASNVTLALEGAPTGVTGSFAPAATSGTSSVLTLTVANTVALGTSTLTVRGTADGLAAQTTTFTLTVTAPGNFSLAASPSSFTVQAGSAAVASTINITRTNGFAGAVAFTHTTTAPAGVTIAFSPTSTTGNSVTMNITVGAGVAAGTYTITVKGNATGLAEQTATVSLTVTAPSGGTGNVSWTFCPQTGVPTWLAFQDGSGPWTQVTPTTSNLLRIFRFNITQKGGVAWVQLDPTTGAADLTVKYGTATEIINAGPYCEGTGAVKTVSGTVAGLGVAGQAIISLGGGSAFVSPPTTAWNIPDVSEGVVDLVATRASVNLSNPAAGQVTDAVVIRRNLSPSNGTTLPVINFDGSEKITPERPGLTITNPAGTMSTTSIFQTANGETGLLGYDLLGSTPYAYTAVPASARQSGDLHLLTATTTATSGASSEFRSTTKFFSAAGAQTLTFGANAPTVTYAYSITSPYLRPRAQFTNSAEYSRQIFINWSNTSGRQNQATVFIWEGYGLGLTVDYTLPDFSGVAGWSNAWGLETGGVSTSLTVTGWTTGGGPGQPPAADGSVTFSAGRSTSP